jgi:hypothetical protein
MTYDEFKSKFIDFEILEELVFLKEKKKLLRWLKENNKYNIFKKYVNLELSREHNVFENSDENDSYDDFTLIDKIIGTCLVYGIQFSKNVTFEDLESRKEKSVSLPSDIRFFKNFYSIFFTLFLKEVMSNKDFNEITNIKIWEK